ncbi:ADP-ribose pyrophosphatase YjhB, NUDIX family [Candidatus Hydrogenisulfobacillus filiaventi]|uniref:ADP-ribose pyrophosphatase YjhB, NUDIX family n=1 Tax=Candidatus Hydrogenisulfobacillus filiaventi TaxID=2707344 RepID=A0A6F8ZH23_9FIRM|nr:NUDIX hydrolase [Bacillota bacterium]CAB1129013.1 ADP-ribose pyrophosphatase YjhB, NUDIX family [Candidatus Hydrogenisulfobacillus filiaventi]
MLGFRMGEASRFQFRVAGLVVQDGRVLLHKVREDDFWAVPGGRGELFEPSAATVARELAEEIGARAEVGPLLWVVEDFFTYRGCRYHELGFYYAVKLLELPPEVQGAVEFAGREPEKRLIFRWFPLQDLPGLRLYPAFLRQEVLDPLPAGVRHVVAYERDTA